MRTYPVIPVRDIVIFPGAITSVFVNRPRSVKAIEAAAERDGLIFVVAQREPSVDNPDFEELYDVGTLCKVLRNIRLPDGTIKLMVEGMRRCRAENWFSESETLTVSLKNIKSVNKRQTQESAALRRSIISNFDVYAGLNPKMPEGVSISDSEIDDSESAVDMITSHTLIKTADKQLLLEMEDVEERMKLLLSILMAENELLLLEHEIQEKVRNEIDKGQRNYYLREQLRVIHNELGENDSASEIEEMRVKATESGMPPETSEKVMREINRYSKMAPLAPEATVSKTYIEWMTELPWDKSSTDYINLKDAARILNRDHYGLEEVKERILEFLAVRKLAAEDMRAQVLCFVGPPGVGKTSLGRSIAATMGRQFVNMSLGGMRDEAEIRGHRRTYIGALPGRIIQKIRQAGTNNPVILMDEIDKLGSDFRGDPSAALLEVLDPEQNCGFTDNFIEMPFDLSKVMFITTANSTASIPRPLLDRMEIIPLPGYVAEEKIKIAKKHLLPRILKEHGLNANDLTITDSVIKHIIGSYTMEAGVRGLDRLLSKLARKVAAKIAEDGRAKATEKNCGITIKKLSGLLGPPKLHRTHIPGSDSVGSAIGMAWTESGGAVLVIEAAVMEGSGQVSYTGNLGDIMQESAQTALAYLRSNAEFLNLTEFDWRKKDIHIHIPEGAVPKEGPSAGITLALSMCSALTGREVDSSFAMTGEMTLHGAVLPIGGVREKILAAKRMGIKKLLIPADNKIEAEELSDWILSGVNIYYVKTISEVFELALKPADTLQ